MVGPRPYHPACAITNPTILTSLSIVFCWAHGCPNLLGKVPEQVRASSENVNFNLENYLKSNKSEIFIDLNEKMC